MFAAVEEMGFLHASAALDALVKEAHSEANSNVPLLIFRLITSLSRICPDLKLVSCTGNLGTGQKTKNILH